MFEARLVTVVVLNKAILCNSATCERGIMQRNNLISGNGTFSTGMITAISGFGGQGLQSERFHELYNKWTLILLKENAMFGSFHSLPSRFTVYNTTVRLSTLLFMAVTKTTESVRHWELH